MPWITCNGFPRVSWKDKKSFESASCCMEKQVSRLENVLSEACIIAWLDMLLCGALEIELTWQSKEKLVGRSYDAMTSRFKTWLYHMSSVATT